MDYISALIGLVFVTILFNFSYPQNALGLLLRARQELDSIKRGHPRRGDSEEFLKKVQGWFFFTDFVQFVAAYFVGFFVAIFTAFHLAAQTQSKIGLFVSIGGSGIMIVAFVCLWKRSIGRVESHGGEDSFTDRTTWLRGRASKGIFHSKFPRRAFLVLFLVTLAALILAVVTGSNFESQHSGEWLRLLALSMGILIVVVIYLINFWGLFIYMPYSSVAELQDCALQANVSANTADKKEPS